MLGCAARSRLPSIVSSSPKKSSAVATNQPIVFFPRLCAQRTSETNVSLAEEPDISTAQRLLAEAGFRDGHNFPRLEMTTWVNSPVTEAVQQMWKKELGIEVGLSLREARVHIAAMESGDYDIGFITAIPDVPDSANVLEEFVSGAPANYPHWSDPRYDELIAQAETSGDPRQRRTIASRGRGSTARRNATRAPLLQREELAHVSTSS